RLLAVDGQARGPEQRLTQVVADGFTNDAAWTGDRYGVAWNDRRFDAYDVFLALFDRGGQKLVPGDVRLTEGRGFSINAHVVWTGSEFVVVWQGEKPAGFF